MQSSFALCMGSSAFRHFIASSIFFKFDASHQAVVNLLVLLFARVRLSCGCKGRCHYCVSSKLCLKLSPSEPKSLQQRLLATLVLPLPRDPKGATVEFVKVKCQHLAQMSLDLYSPSSCLRITYNSGTACYQLPSSELVLHGDCAAQRSEFAKL